MTAQELFIEIRQFCEVNANPDLVVKYSKFFKEGYDAYGLTREQLYCKRDSILAQEDINLDLVIETAELLLPTGKYEETSFASVLIRAFQDQFTAETFKVVDHWFDIGIINWGHTDVTCSEIIGIFIKKNLIQLEDLAAWRISERKFKRRAVPVSMLAWLPDHEDFSTLFSFIDPMMMDTERVVHQGLGWFLREAWKEKREETEEFLLKWKNDAARLIYQYATEKMLKEERGRFRKEKS